MPRVSAFGAAACLAVALFMSSVLTASAATSTDPARYEDLDVGISHDLAGFDISGPAFGPASLTLRYGRWNGFGTATMDLVPTFNGTALSGVLLDNTYFSSPTSFTWDVSALVISGTNTLSVVATQLSGGTSTYTVGEATLEYATAPVPLPAGALLLLTGLGALAFKRRAA